MTEAMTAKAWADEMLRFSCFDGLENDQCPCCGGPVTIEDSNVRRIDEHGIRKPQGRRLFARPWA